MGTLQDDTFRFGSSPTRHVETVYLQPWCFDCDRSQVNCTCDNDAKLVQQLQDSIAAKLAELKGKKKRSTS